MVECVFEYPRGVPEDYEGYCQAAVSHITDTIRLDVLDHIKGKKLFALYTSRKFVGFVWWEDNLYHIQLSKKSDSVRTVLATVSSPYISAVVDVVRNIFGVD